MARSNQVGSVNSLLVASCLLGVMATVMAGGFAWSYMNYMDQKNNVDAKVATAVKVAEAAQAKKLEAGFIEREKQPTVRFNGPDDLGHVTFNYPKTWSVYIEDDGKTGSYEAYLNPGVVPTVAATQPYATRVVIEDRLYETTLKSYEALVKKGTLKSTPITINGQTGVRLDGEFTKQRTGSAVVFKVRDKTLTIASDSTTFRADFDSIVVGSLSFNP